jgi:hypothetical protein
VATGVKDDQTDILEDPDIMYNDPNAQPPYGQSPYTSPYEQQYAPQQPQYPPTTQYGAPPVYPPPVYVPVQEQRKSNKVLWIVLSIIGALLLLVGGSCCAVFYFAGKTVQNISTQISATATADQATSIAEEPPPSQQAQDYYLAISVQDYTNAYSYLEPNMTASDGTALTQAKFTQEAQALDASEGTVTDYTATADPNDATKVTVQVTRSKGKTYTVHLTFQQGDYQWVISSFDTI